MKITDAIKQLESAVAKLEEWHGKQDYDEQELSEIAKTYWTIRGFDEEIKALKSRVFKVRDSLEKGIMPAQMEARDTDMVRVPTLGRSFYPTVKTSASIIKDEDGTPTKAFDWLRTNNYGDIIQQTVNSGTLASFAKSLIEEEGRDLPEELFKVSTYTTIGFSKYTPKDK